MSGYRHVYQGPGKVPDMKTIGRLGIMLTALLWPLFSVTGRDLDRVWRCDRIYEEAHSACGGTFVL